MKNKKILWLSDSPFYSTGYSSQSLFLLNGLADKGWDITYVANGYLGQRLPKGCVTLSDGTPFKFNLWPTYHKRYGADVIQQYLRETKADVFGVLLDTFMLWEDGYMNLDFAPSKTSTFWFPSDGHGRIPMNCDNILKKFDLPVAMSKFGQRQTWDVHKLKTLHIPHAVDHNHFKSMTDEEKIKLKEEWGLAGKFVVGSVTRNQGRKALDHQIKAFAKFCKDKPDAIMLLHTDPNDAAQTFNMQELIQRLHMENRIRFTGLKYSSPFPYAKMKDVYNLFDIFLLTTTGEGFGIPTVEAMSCEIPPVVTDCTTTNEFLIEGGQCGEPIKVATAITGGYNVERSFADIDDCALKLEKLYKDADLRKQYGKIGREKVLANYTWEKVINAWDELLTESINE